MTLTVIPTPIGNLADITLRALSALRDADLVLCEDTRVSRVLLQAHEIDKPLLSLHKFNERARQEAILARLRKGDALALISSAGTPAICDPGQRLILACHQEEIEVIVLPGPCAIITALVASGLCTVPFQFLGFTERNPGKQLRKALDYQGASVFFLSPRVIERTLKVFEDLEQIRELTPRELVLVKELTKKFESQFRGTAQQLLGVMREKGDAQRGEWVLVIAPPNERERPFLEGRAVHAVSIAKQARGQSTGRFIGEVAAQLGVKRQDLYRFVSSRAVKVESSDEKEPASPDPQD